MDLCQIIHFGLPGYFGFVLLEKINNGDQTKNDTSLSLTLFWKDEKLTDSTEFLLLINDLFVGFLFSAYFIHNSVDGNAFILNNK